MNMTSFFCSLKMEPFLHTIILVIQMADTFIVQPIIQSYFSFPEEVTKKPLCNLCCLKNYGRKQVTL